MTSIVQNTAEGRVLPMYHWEPGTGFKNFGDEISPLMVGAMLAGSGAGDIRVVTAGKDQAKLLAVGSVIQQARNGDVVWGAGVNGKAWPRFLDKHKDIRFHSVRGPLSHETVTGFGIECPAVFGDPGLLFMELFRNEINAADAEINGPEQLGSIFVPNLNDLRFLKENRIQPPAGIRMISPGEHPFRMAALIRRAEKVYASSLHGIIFAESAGKPTFPIVSLFEPQFKYSDYFEGTGRSDVTIYQTLDAAVAGARDSGSPKFDREALINSFPRFGN